MNNDKSIVISVGNSRKSMQWPQQTILWAEFIEKLSKPQRTQESFIEYKSWAKQKQDELKEQ